MTSCASCRVGLFPGCNPARRACGASVEPAMPPEASRPSPGLCARLCDPTECMDLAVVGASIEKPGSRIVRDGVGDPIGKLNFSGYDIKTGIELVDNAGRGAEIDTAVDQPRRGVIFAGRPESKNNFAVFRVEHVDVLVRAGDVNAIAGDKRRRVDAVGGSDSPAHAAG